MTSSERCMFIFICIATFQIVVNCRDLTTWGEDRSGSYFATSKHKFAIPFTTRSTTVVFPDDFTDDRSNGLTSNQIIRGIKHYNDVKDPDCKPKLEISKGGINQYFATFSIKSKKGCAIDSTVEFITERM